MSKTLSESERTALRRRIEATAGGRAPVPLIEGFGAMRAQRLNRDALTIQSCTMLGPTSTNGATRKRRYSKQAMEQVVRMAEGLPAYANHVSPADAFKPRDVRDLIGRHVNVRFDSATGRVVSDLHLLEHQAPWVFSLAERLGDSIGNSLVSKGLVRMEGDTEVVDEIVALRSCDLVTDPASTKNLWEARDAMVAELDALLVEQDVSRWVAEAREPDPHARVAEILNGKPLPSGIHAEAVRLLRLPSAPSESAARTDLHERLRRAVSR